MSSTSISYPALAGQVEFDLNFPFLRRTDVKVTVDGVDRPFTWITDQRVRLVTPLAQAALVRIARDTEVDVAAVTFADGSIFTAADLNAANRQILFKTQEVAERALAGEDLTEALAILEASEGRYEELRAELVALTANAFSTVVPTTRIDTSTNYLRVTHGRVLPNNTGKDIFFYIPITQPKGELGLILTVEGINPNDPLQVRMPDGSAVTDAELNAPGYIVVTRPGGEGHYVMVSPTRSKGSPSYFQRGLEVGTATNTLLVRPLGTLPDNTGFTTTFRVRLLRNPTELSMSACVEGINPTDPILLVYPDGTSVLGSALKAGDEIEFIRTDAPGPAQYRYVLTGPVGGSQGAPGSSTGASNYDRIAARFAASNAAVARKAAHKALKSAASKQPLSGTLTTLAGGNTPEARAALGLAIGTNVQAQHPNLQAWVGANLTLTATPFSPTVSSNSGAITTSAVNVASFVRIGPLVYFVIQVTVSNVGTATNAALTVTLPSQALAAATFVGVENAVTGQMLQGNCSSGSNVLTIRTVAGAGFLANNVQVRMAGTYLSV